MIHHYICNTVGQVVTSPSPLSNFIFHDLFWSYAGKRNISAALFSLENEVGELFGFAWEEKSESEMNISWINLLSPSQSMWQIGHAMRSKDLHDVVSCSVWFIHALFQCRNKWKKAASLKKDHCPPKNEMACSTQQNNSVIMSTLMFCLNDKIHCSFFVLKHSCCSSHKGTHAATVDDDILYNQCCYQGFSIDFNFSLQIL